MSRPALRKIDPSLDLTHYLKTFDQLPRPWNASQLFGRDAPLEVEVGPGKGLFLRTFGTANPAVNFLGIEIAAKYAAFAAAMSAKLNLSNVIIAKADALRVFCELLPDASLQAVHVYFPDPWWKKRHKKRRLMQPTFLQAVERTLSAGGALHFWTDVEEYFHTALKLIAACTRLQGPLDVRETSAQHDMDYRTHFERRMRRLKLPVYRSQFLKMG
ncbi:MAG: tRNA (guanosine(46)-N7)-methyltransferase TrmB [Thermoguttaceae bacterium]